MVASRPPERSRRYKLRLRARVLSNRRKGCLACRSIHNLQFAHRRETGLNGKGRGSKDRLLDVIHYPRAYALLCSECHLHYDAGILKPPSRGQGWRGIVVDPSWRKATVKSFRPVYPSRGLGCYENGNACVATRVEAAQIAGKTRSIAEEATRELLAEEERFRSEARNELARIVGREYWKDTP